MVEIEAVAKKVIRECLAPKEGELFLVVTDPPTRVIGETLYQAAVSLGLQAHLLLMPETEKSGAEPTTVVAEAMKASSIVVCPTKHSLTHTLARKEACARGARIATMPGITEDMFVEGAITADYGKLAELTDRITEVLTAGSRVRLEKEGRVLELSIEGRKGVSSNGLYHTPGSFGNLPTGEAYIAPVEGSAEGTILIDGSLAEYGKLRGPLEVVIHKGLAMEFKGSEAEWLQRILGDREEARNVGELGIGTNNKARLTGIILEDEKVYGTVHIAFGTNSGFGGKVSAGVHIDGIILKPNLWVDDRLILKNGEFVI
ncbi:MAG: aminopeptidase [Spirochaetes bacterium]|nr:aminopeptidase [Spirochaetota bacterium]